MDMRGMVLSTVRVSGRLRVYCAILSSFGSPRVEGGQGMDPADCVQDSNLI